LTIGRTQAVRAFVKVKNSCTLSLLIWYHTPWGKLKQHTELYFSGIQFQ